MKTNDTNVTITKAEIATLNAARSVLADIEHRYLYEAANYRESGMVYAHTRNATQAIFDLLNCAKSFGGVSMTEEQIYNGPLAASGGGGETAA